MTRIVFATLILMSLWNCSNDLDLTTEWKDIPVVYGIINADSTTNYVRVEKVFLDPETNALQLAQISDSIYYQNVKVEIERPKRNERILLNRVDGNEEGITRDSGIFATNPNTLYKLDLPKAEQLEGGEEISIIITRADEQTPATATTTLLEPFTIVSGQPADLINWSEYDRTVRVAWRPEGEAASVYDIKFIINYEESTGGSNEFISKSLEWKVAENLIREDFNAQRLTVEILGREFYSFLASELEANTSIQRRFVDMDLEIIAGGSELLQYINIRQVNTGITSSQEIPTFSNIEGGLGLFTARITVEKKGFNLTAPAIDSLVEGRLTRDLNFLD